jgi:ZIP family zinc transporter
MNTTNATRSSDSDDNITWSSPNVKWAIIVSIGARLATAVGGSLAFCPAVLRGRQATVLGISLALSAGVMLYVSFIEIFGKSLDSISETGDYSDAGAAAITTVCFFAGMGVCVLLEILVNYISERGGGLKHEDICPAHIPGDAVSTHSHTACAPDDCDGDGDRGDGGDRQDTEPPHKGVAPEATALPTIQVEVVSKTKEVEHGGAGGTGPGHLPSSASDGELIGNKEEAAKLTRMGLMTAVAIAIHNFPEGLATFLATVEDTSLGASLGVAIAIHNIPEGLCVAMPIYYATGSKYRAFLWSVLSGITEPIGGIVGFAALQPVFTPLVFGIVFSMVGGMMVFIVCHELLPAAHHYMGDGNKTTAWLITGMIVMATSLVVFLI